MIVKIDPVFRNIQMVSKGNRSYLVYHYLYKAIAALVNKFAGGKVLDIGCGYEPYKKRFADNKTVTEYTGCDVSQNSQVTVDIVYDAKIVPMPAESIDTIFYTQVIEHVFGHKHLLKDAHRLLKQNGRLILSAPLYWPVHDEPYGFYRFTGFGLA